MSNVARHRVLMLLENNPYAHDSRVRREAESLTNAGYRVCVISPCEDEARRFGRTTVNGVAVYSYPAPPEGDGFAGYLAEYGFSMFMMAILSVVVLIRRGFDIVHAHNPPDTLVLLAVVYKALGKRFVFDHHDLAPEMYEAKFGSGAKPGMRRALEFFERATFRAADHVISTNESYRRVAEERGGVPPDEITVVRNGPNTVVMKPSPPIPELRARASLLIGYVGIMGSQDGVDLLLRAIGHLVNDFHRRDVLCVLIGKGDMLPQLEVLSSELQIEEYVWFTGWTPPGELPSYLSTMDVCVDPDPSNVYNDRCTMIKMMEYMAMEKPIVAFDLPEHRVTAADAALYATENDPKEFARLIVDLADDPELRRRMGEVGRARIEAGLSWDFQEARLLNAYQQVASG